METLYRYLLIVSFGAILILGCKKEEKPSPILITTLDATQLTASSAMSGGMISNDGGKQIVSRGVVWSLAINPSTEDNIGIRFEGTGAGTFNSFITNLSANTDYYLRAFATNAEGTTYGNEVQFTTKAGQVPSISDSDFSNITHNEATLSAEVTDDGDLEIALRGFCWGLQPNPTIEDNQMSEAGGIGSYSLTISNLEPNTQYYARPFATNASGTGYGSEVSFVTTYEPVDDGFYFVGDGTALLFPKDEGLLIPTRNEANQEIRESLLEIFVAVKGDSGGFNIINVTGGTAKMYGPGPDFAFVPFEERISDEPPEASIWRGSIIETDTKFTVPIDGLYHIVFDTELGVGAVVHVANWGMIGAATPDGWGSDTEMASTGFDLNEITFQATNVPMTKADFRFRYAGGWKVIIMKDVAFGDGVRVNTNLGGAVDNLIPGGTNIINTVGGIYTAKMTWTLGDGYKAELTKTGDLDYYVYTDTELGLIGGSLIVDGASWGWNDGYQLHKPVVEGETNYTWTWNNIEFSTEGYGFRIREGENWNGLSFGYTEVIMAGLAADNFETNINGNFIPLETGVYNIVFHIDAVVDERTFTINPADSSTKQ